MRLIEAAFDVLRRAGEPLSPAEIVRQIKSARIPIDANEPLDDESVKVELEHVVEEATETSGIVQTPSGRFTLPSMLDRTLRTGTEIATTTASTINPISIASAIARSNVGAMWTLEDATKEVLSRARRPLSIDEMTTMLRAAGVLKGTRSKDEAEVRSQLIQDMLQHGGESTFVRVGNNTYGLRYFPAQSSSTDTVEANDDEDGEQQQSPSPGPSPIEGEKEQTAPLLREARGKRDDSDTSDAALLRRIRTLSNQRFERFIVVFLASIGMTDVVVINRLRPGELDIHASMDIAEVMDINFSVQALNWHRDVHGGDIQLLRGGMRIGDHGLIITTSEFQRGAIEEANRQGATPIATINGTQLAEIAQTRGAAKILGTTSP
ncbi:MAG: hypothetical protein F4Y63_00455 [Chloroflexi bacterium]|nr:hypothetical protein [Chloroflexota bacterium]MYK60792.1 hypothetical protein [Chloroflexota bacterium]